MLGHPISGQALSDLDFFKVEQTNIVGAATVAAAFKVARPLATAVGGTSAVVDTMKRAVALLDGGGFAGAATLANEPLSVKRGLGLPTLAGSATMTDAAKVARSMADAVHGTSAVVAPLTVHRLLIVGHAGQATVVASSKVARAFIASAAGHAAMADTLAVARHLSLTVLGDVVLTAALTVGGAGNHFAVSIVGQASGTFSLGKLRALAAAVLGDATIVDSLAIRRALRDVMSGSSALSLTMAERRAFTTAIQGTVALADTLAVARAFGLAVDGQALLEMAIISAVVYFGTSSVTTALPTPQGRSLPEEQPSSVTSALPSPRSTTWPI